jgi:probable addiction module antidote protein
MPKRTRDHESWLIEKLTDPTRAASYLNAAREDSQEMFFEALRDVAQARQNMSGIAKDADVTRESLYKVTSAKGNPTYGTFDAVLRALGLDFDIKPRGIRVAPIPPASSTSSRRRTGRLTARPQVKIKQITSQNSRSTANVVPAQPADSYRKVDPLFWCDEQPIEHSGVFLGNYANPADNGASPTAKQLLLPPAYQCALLERKYVRQEDAGNTPTRN